MNKWYESTPPGWPWSSLWYNYVRCKCGGIRQNQESCGACGAPSSTSRNQTLVVSNEMTDECAVTQMGAEGRYEDHVYLQMLEREWLRPISDEDRFLTVIKEHRPAARAVVILVFWTYFETKIQRLIAETCAHFPTNVLEDLLRKYNSVGSRMDRLYKILFSTTFRADLQELGYPDIVAMLQKVQERRNSFAHGHPEAIDDQLVEEVISALKREHESWIAVFNRRMAGTKPAISI